MTREFSLSDHRVRAWATSHSINSLFIIHSSSPIVYCQVHRLLSIIAYRGISTSATYTPIQYLTIQLYTIDYYVVPKPFPNYYYSDLSMFYVVHNRPIRFQLYKRSDNDVVK